MIRIVTKILIIMLILAISTHLVYSTNNDHNPSNNVAFYFIIYGSSGCPHCINMKTFLESNYGSHRVFFMDARTSSDAYDRLQALVKLGVPGGVPLTFIIVEDTVACAIQGEFRNKAILEEMFTRNDKNEFILYTAGIDRLIPTKIISYRSNYTHKDFINFLNGISSKLEIDVRKPEAIDGGGAGSTAVAIAPLLIVLALIDSINPCTFALYTSFTLSCITGKKMEKGPPILFIAMIYVGYLLFGLGLSYVAYMLGKFRFVFFIIALVLGLINIFSAGRMGLYSFKCKWCDKLRLPPRFFKDKYLYAILISLFSIIFLLPCSSGPLIVFSALISGFELAPKIVLLGIYNMLFITPLVAIYLLLRTTARVKRIAQWIEDNTGVLEFLSGVALLLIAILLVGASG